MGTCGGKLSSSATLPPPGGTLATSRSFSHILPSTSSTGSVSGKEASPSSSVTLADREGSRGRDSEQRAKVRSRSEGSVATILGKEASSSLWKGQQKEGDRQKHRESSPRRETTIPHKEADTQKSTVAVSSSVHSSEQKHAATPLPLTDTEHTSRTSRRSRLREKLTLKSSVRRRKREGKSGGGRGDEESSTSASTERTTFSRHSSRKKRPNEFMLALQLRDSESSFLSGQIERETYLQQRAEILHDHYGTPAPFFRACWPRPSSFTSYTLSDPSSSTLPRSSTSDGSRSVRLRHKFFHTTSSPSSLHNVSSSTARAQELSLSKLTLLFVSRPPCAFVVVASMLGICYEEEIYQTAVELNREVSKRVAAKTSFGTFSSNPISSLSTGNSGLSQSQNGSVAAAESMRDLTATNNASSSPGTATEEDKAAPKMSLKSRATSDKVLSASSGAKSSPYSFSSDLTYSSSSVDGYCALIVGETRIISGLRAVLRYMAETFNLSGAAADREQVYKWTDQAADLISHVDSLRWSYWYFQRKSSHLEVTSFINESFIQCAQNWERHLEKKTHHHHHHHHHHKREKSTTHHNKEGNARSGNTDGAVKDKETPLGFLCGNELTMADIAVACLVEYVLVMADVCYDTEISELLHEEFPKLYDLRVGVSQHPCNPMYTAFGAMSPLAGLAASSSSRDVANAFGRVMDKRTRRKDKGHEEREQMGDGDKDRRKRESGEGEVSESGKSDSDAVSVSSSSSLSTLSSSSGSVSSFRSSQADELPAKESKEGDEQILAGEERERALSDALQRSSIGGYLSPIETKSSNVFLVGESIAREVSGDYEPVSYIPPVHTEGNSENHRPSAAPNGQSSTVTNHVETSQDLRGNLTLPPLYVPETTVNMTPLRQPTNTQDSEPAVSPLTLSTSKTPPRSQEQARSITPASSRIVHQTDETFMVSPSSLLSSASSSSSIPALSPQALERSESGQNDRGATGGMPRISLRVSERHIRDLLEEDEYDENGKEMGRAQSGETSESMAGEQWRRSRRRSRTAGEEKRKSVAAAGRRESFPTTGFTRSNAYTVEDENMNNSPLLRL